MQGVLIFCCFKFRAISGSKELVGYIKRVSRVQQVERQVQRCCCCPRSSSWSLEYLEGIRIIFTVSWGRGGLLNW